MQKIINRYFTRAGASVLYKFEWGTRDAVIRGANGEIVYEQKDVYAPTSWSDNAVNIVASKYFRNGEKSVYQMIDRVVDAIAEAGEKEGYFKTELIDKDTFSEELKYILIAQMASFNSPVWFNCGIDEKPQVSACFINSVKDDLEDILDLVKREGRLFRKGSGSGTNYSNLRSSEEPLSGGGTSSGPVSFMKILDASAGTIKSAGISRRAARMGILDVSHPDILEFINCKVKEERKAKALIESGFDGSFDGDVYSNLPFQNTNHSVRVTDEFMNAVLGDDLWHLKSVTTGETLKTISAKKLFMEIAKAAHECGDPGLQFHDTINKDNTVANVGEIRASNPCSEYVFLDDSACNLASINLVRLMGPSTTDGHFSTRLEHVVRVMILAQDILVGMASYPTKEIEENSLNYRPLGLGYANLGALLMIKGHPYGSKSGCEATETITSLMTAYAWEMSSFLAQITGKSFLNCKESSVYDVITKMRDKCWERGLIIPHEILESVLLSKEHSGLRNSQVTLLAPTGTIGFMMDCATTGIEPELALVKTKKMVGGGVITTLSRCAEEYIKNNVADYAHHINYIKEFGGVDPEMPEKHQEVLNCAFQSPTTGNYLSPASHIRMMAAAQPYLSGAISKTVSLPKSFSPEMVYDIFMDAWKEGLKSITVYRDGSKGTQPITTMKKAEDTKDNVVEIRDTVQVLDNEAVQTGNQNKPVHNAPVRKRLPKERNSITHKYKIGDHTGYITGGMFEDGSLGEIFVSMSKEGSTISGLVEALAICVSTALQYNVPLEVLVKKLSNGNYEPSGYTGNPDLPYAKSITDYLFRWLKLKFIENKNTSVSTEPVTLPIAVNSVNNATSAEIVQFKTKDSEYNYAGTVTDSKCCSYCGSLMIPNGSCYVCASCGQTTGCS